MVRRSEWGGEDPTTAQFGGIIESTTPANVSEYDVVLLGEPYDGGPTGRPGAREGPAAIRAALAGVDTHHLDAGPVDSVGDLGTAEIPFGGSVSTVQDALRETVSDLHGADTIPIFLGGDGSVTYANVVGLLESTTATDGGGYITDGGFGEDEESVGDVEHFDPTAEDEEPDGEDEKDAAESTDENDESGETDANTGGEDGSDGDRSNDDGDREATDSDDDGASPDDEDGDDSTDEEAEDSETTDSDDEEGDDSDDPEAESSETGDSDDEEESTDDTDETDEDDETTGQSETIADDAADQTGFGTDSDDTETALIDETESADSAGTGTDNATATSSVGVISLAPRLDCKQVEEPTARSRFRDLLEAGVDSLAVLGARHFESATAEAEYLRDRDGTVVTAEEVAEDPVEATDHALDAMAAADHLYVSIDLSVLDPAAAPGVSEPAPGGLTSRELFRVVRLLVSDDRLAGLELIETVPSLDESSRTVDAAARAVAHAVSTVE
jgi:arginase family enzyme